LRIPEKAQAYEAGKELFGNDPGNLENQYILSQLAYAADLPLPAIEHIQRVIQQKPEERYYVLMAQYLQKRDGNNTAAFALINEHIAQNPDWFSARLFLAREYTAAQDWPNAKAQFLELLRIQPTNYPLNSSLGFVYAKLEQPAQAAASFAKYLKNTPASERENEILIHLTLADAYSKKGDYAQALKWLNKAPFATEVLDIQMKTFDVYMQQKHYGKAREVLRKFAPQGEEESVRITLGLSKLEEEEKKPARAASLIEDALKTWPDQPDLLYERAMVAERQSDLPTVEQFLRRLIDVKPDNPHGYNALGYTLAENNIRLEEALALIQKANALAPEDAYILDSLGWVHFRLGNYEQAAETLEKAFALRQDEEIGLHLLELYLAQDRAKEAQAMLKLLKAKFPDSNQLTQFSRRIREIKL
ncbi:MAG: tetratricopeptide repeat protein, partial [Limnobacter sp.]|nr:tetratricopeptide repeat protein [Limnobacter sp.]